MATIGVYGWDLRNFVAALRAVDARLLLDVRQRRGVRGSEYAWANAVRLQAILAAADVGYEHHKELAPTTELRQLQYAEDARAGVGKRSRVLLADAYRDRYAREILDRVQLVPIVEAMPVPGATIVFCVERDPEACHRGLITHRMAALHGVSVEHLRPPAAPGD